METAGDRIRKLREEAGLTQSELARLLSTSRATVIGWESGANYPGYHSLIGLAHFFNVTIDYIAGLQDEDLLRLDNLDQASVNAIRQLVRCLKYRSGLTS